MSELQEPDLPPGATFGAYQIVRPLGVGMSGTVYEALELATSRRLALKVLHASIARKRNMVHRFMREATAAAKLQHPHVVATYDVGQWEGRYFLAMELLHGENLAQRLKREGRLLPKVAVDLILPVLAAVARVHDLGIVHRDLKPDNVFLLLTPGLITPKLLDFGLSKDLDVDDSLTQTSVVLGTPAYMSPEQTRGARNITPRTDQYALGVILYECVTGRRPFAGGSLFDLIHNINAAPVRRMVELDPAIAPAFEAVVMRALDRDPDQRFESIRAFGAALCPFASPELRARWEPEFLDEPPPTEVVRRSFFPLESAATEPVDPAEVGTQATVPAYSLVGSESSITPVFHASALRAPTPAPMPATRLPSVVPPEAPEPYTVSSPAMRYDERTLTPQETSQTRLASRSVVMSRRVLFASGALAVLLVMIAGVVALTRTSRSEARTPPDGSIALAPVTPAFDETLRAPPVVLTNAPPPDVATAIDASVAVTNASDVPVANGSMTAADTDAATTPIIQQVILTPVVDAGTGRNPRRWHRYDRYIRYRRQRPPVVIPIYRRPP
jgi:serine/threonine-protein kinase